MTWTFVYNHFSIQALLQALSVASVLAYGFMVYTAFGLICNTQSPLVVVLRYACIIFFMPVCLKRFLYANALRLLGPAVDQWNQHSLGEISSSSQTLRMNNIVRAISLSTRYLGSPPPSFTACWRHMTWTRLPQTKTGFPVLGMA